ncbi:GNAT family N-acetyltransferase [Falsigemmobacter faecalis]|uniref:L-ornithine N(alpha)-acyltransferase n=1 Tax=Falsigemmobacter faecalis TaxID=2488730 RepID=A0A3P3DST5_9RHOB|nr:GNAT family N-acyltransferase [Falsigemmobacter faecalis]RRH76592.1 GNAT family N-acetyltransferase [Falsigemmobacter faecalis]
MSISEPQFSLRLARDLRDLQAAQRLRYEVFVEELGGTGPLVDHENRLEADEFDPFFDHLLLIDARRDTEEFPGVVGVYRLLTAEKAAQMGRYYSEGEYDLSPLKSSGRRLVELGRSCVHRDYRGGSAMLQLWNGLAEYVLERDIEVMFGVASFHGTDPQGLQQSLSWLHHMHLAPPDLRVTALPEGRQDMNLLPPEALERRAALAEMPPLIKAYLRLGGFVGEGAFIDHAFNTIDICLIIDTARMSERHRSFYTRKQEPSA